MCGLLCFAVLLINADQPYPSPMYRSPFGAIATFVGLYRFGVPSAPGLYASMSGGPTILPDHLALRRHLHQHRLERRLRRHLRIRRIRLSDTRTRPPLFPDVQAVSHALKSPPHDRTNFPWRSKTTTDRAVARRVHVWCTQMFPC